MIQETKLRNKNRIKLPGYQIFEQTRTEEKTSGGGILTAINEDFEPVLVSEGSDEAEVLVVQASIGNKLVSFINGYGKQERDTENVRVKFFNKLNEDIEMAKHSDSMICIELDANGKLGREVIKGDPSVEMSANGKLLYDIIQRHNLIVVNGSEKCSGVITRYNQTSVRTEQSVLDYLIVCNEFYSLITKMTVDEERIHTLTKYSTKAGNKKIVYSDHNMLICETKVKWNPVKRKERTEIFNFNSIDGQQKYKKLLNKDTTLTDCFKGGDSFEVKANKWFKEYLKIIKRSFNKIRITEKPKKGEISSKIKIVKEVKKKLIEASKTGDVVKIQKVKKELRSAEDEVANICAARNKQLLEEHVKGISSMDGGFNPPKMWKIKNKVIKKSNEKPTAKKDKKGNLVTSHKLLKNLYKDTYTERLKHREISADISDLKELKEKLFDLRLKETTQRKTEPWTEDQLFVVLKSLKKNKARDPWGLIYELFRPEWAGSDLTNSLLLLFNGIKENMFVPSFLLLANITSLYKNKGERSNFDNDRGIFGLVKIRIILDKLMYKDLYPIIDKKMSDSNIGAREERNIRDHLFVVNGVVNEVINGKGEDTDLQIYDISKCFDSMWLKETLNDVYDTNIKNDKLALLYETNKKSEVAVKTPIGMTERNEMKEIIMQGGIFGGIFCALQMDILGKKNLQRDNGNNENNENEKEDKKLNDKDIFKYRECLQIPPLGFIDDCAGFSRCGTGSLIMNVKTEETIKSKKLSLSNDKCHLMHFGKSKNQCVKLKVKDSIMEKVQNEKYLGQYISSDGKNDKNIKERSNKGTSALCQVYSMLIEVSLGSFYFHIGLILRDTNVINGILFGAEAWYGVTEKQIKVLEDVDLNYMRKLFNAHSKTAKEAFHLETGKLPVKFILINRRLMYWFHIISRDPNSLLYKFYSVQKSSPVRHDWVTQIDQDKELVNLCLTDEEVIKMTKRKFKRIVKQKVISAALLHLNSVAETHSKSKNLIKSELKCEKYIMDPRFNTEEVQLLFQLRTRMFPVKSNFKNKHGNNLSCVLCKIELCDQAHQMSCHILQHFVPVLRSRNVDYNDVFGSVDEQLEIVRIFSEVRNQREILLDALNIVAV